MDAKHALPLLILGALFGCQSTPTAAPRVTALVLHERLTVSADRAAVTVQAGEVKNGNGLDRYRAYCRFELTRLSDTAREIVPRRFKILRQYETVPAARAPQGLQYARLIPTSGDPSYFVFATVFELTPNEAGLSGLTCQHWEVPTPNPPRHLTADEIGSALGAIAHLE